MTPAPPPPDAKARTVIVPENAGSHCANPFASTEMLVLPTQPLLSPTHQKPFMILDGLGGLEYLPVAANCTCPPGFGATAVAGVTVIDCSMRVLLMPLLQPSVIRMASRKEETARAVNFVIMHPRQSRTLTEMLSCPCRL